MLEVYIKDGCPYCRKQLDEFDAKGLVYKLHNVSSDSKALKNVRTEYGADKVPVVVEDGVLKTIGFQGMG
ncbi:MAG TPA: glutaredoxin family protein [Candidatus Limnocylindrales bacterium]|nr:glutaredoxin family protein [Candidatus Limnocylindrales bacterium]